MKKIGLVGGISWVSTMDYYKFINEGVNSKLGGLNFAECVIYSLNFGDIQALIDRGAECIILGCTEIPMLISQADVEIPIFDTTKIHSEAIVEFIIS